MRRAAVLAAALLTVASLALPGAAQAGQSAMNFRLRSAAGYEITVIGFGQTVGLNVARLKRSKHSGAATTYIARGELGASSIKAGFGSFGRVSMRFQPSGKVVYGKRHQGCAGPDRTTTRFGHFVGSLRFRGEDGYVAIDVHRAKGRVRSPVSLRCDDSAAVAGASGDEQTAAGKRTILRAGFRLGVHHLRFEASGDRASATRYIAISEQSQGQIAIYRDAFVSASPRTFTSDSSLSFATVSPPPPFSGTATLRRVANGARDWAGSLAVSFLGAPAVPLVGSQFRTELTRAW